MRLLANPMIIECVGVDELSILASRFAFLRSRRLSMSSARFDDSASRPSLPTLSRCVLADIRASERVDKNGMSRFASSNFMRIFSRSMISHAKLFVLLPSALIYASGIDRGC